MAERECKRGFILGKFMPPHMGHVFACEAGLNMVDEMTVLVCSTDAEPMSGALRYEWMCESLPNALVRHLHRNLPQEPGDDSDFWQIWTRVVKEFHPEPIDYLFGSEAYVFKLAQCIDAVPVLIDPNREVFSVSGTVVRAAPLAEWTNLPHAVRAHYARRVCVLGPECSGKSVLVQRLAERYQTRHMPEYGRIYDETYKQTSSGPRVWQSAELLMLARTHKAMSKALLPYANKVLIEDTDIIQTMIWEHYLIGENSEEMLALLVGARLADFYLVLAPTVPFMDDGGRYFDDLAIRVDFFNRAVAMLAAREIPHLIIDDDNWSAREAKAYAGVSEFLKF